MRRKFCTAPGNILPLSGNRIRPAGKSVQLSLHRQLHPFPDLRRIIMLFRLTIIHEVSGVHTVGIHQNRLQKAFQHPQIKREFCPAVLLFRFVSCIKRLAVFTAQFLDPAVHCRKLFTGILQQCFQ